MGIEATVVALTGHGVSDARGHGNTEIGLDQDLLQPVERLLVELPSGEHAGKILRQRIRRAGQTLAELGEPASLRFRLSRRFGLVFLPVSRWPLLGRLHTGRRVRSMRRRRGL